MKTIKIIIGLGLSFFSSVLLATSCHPFIDDEKKQYIIGYGSLMNESSKQKTSIKAKKNIPLILLNYKRGWFARGKMKNQQCTFLGVTKAKYHYLNAVIFEVMGKENVMAFDRREIGYCRHFVDARDIKLLLPLKLNHNTQIWVYQPSLSIFKKPSPQYPIKQKYLDIFLSGCHQIQKRYGLKGFYKTCLKTTYDWQ